MVFPQNLKAEYLGKAVGGTLALATTGYTYDLAAGVVGIYPVKYDQVQETAITSATTSDVVIGAGNWRTSDGPTPFMGGYKENFWTKPIKLSQVKRFAKVVAHAAQNQIVSIGWDQTLTGSTSDVGPTFFCGTDYNLKVQVLGNATLRTFNKFMYQNFDANGGCCGTDCSSGCTTTYADAACIMLQWKDRIYATPEWTSFILPQVFVNVSGVKTEVFSQADVDAGRTNGSAYECNTSDPSSVVACLQLTVAYADTTFGDCTFTLTDTYDVEPLYVQASLVTQDGSPCAVNTTINTSVPNLFTEIQAPLQVKGVGRATRDGLILEGRYRQETFPDSMSVDSLRMREIEDANTPIDNTTNAGLYDKVVIEYFVPNDKNSSGVYDGSYYTFILHVASGTTTTNFTTLFQACLTAAGSNVTLETI